MTPVSGLSWLLASFSLGHVVDLIPWKKENNSLSIQHLVPISTNALLPLLHNFCLNE